ncbi:TetR/AcrR family transcriptional regulator [Paenibacillus sp. FSL R7-0331]|uniref:TetR/AcrR family transcriptional regulator n=1 Tax=Paenibacillus sp. FSL R7-0331 TaxID=1536773 RepID=UPI0004F68B39|nr:TetR/AcrR family transcriptional regulator [Paenibacillus sp. FSL R7-0331]AIQ52975.1 TetR family transcriptional regulator [Paenibacillus sp. FSL R7-0331]
MSPRAGLDTQTLVLAAAELADEYGMEGVTLALLAAKLGVRSPSLYNHVNGLKELRILLAIHGLQLLYADMSASIKGVSGGDAVHAISRAYVKFAQQRPGLYETTLQAPEEGNAGLEEAGAKPLQLIISVLSGYELGKSGELHAVRGLRSILHGFAALRNKGGFGMPLDLEESLTRLIDAYIAGIGCMRTGD